MLFKVDAVRYSLPAILQSLSTNSGSVLSLEDRILGYKSTVANANASIDDLGHLIDTTQGVTAKRVSYCVGDELRFFD